MYLIFLLIKYSNLVIDFKSKESSPKIGLGIHYQIDPIRARGGGMGMSSP